MLINITGPSGVGKTTISTLLSVMLEQRNTSILNLCGDDLHKWARHDPKWNDFTHLNPSANNLREGDEQIYQLLKGQNINRNIYSHETGNFIQNQIIKPSDIIINEGLHSLYNNDLCDIADLNIYVDTEHDLKYQWKLSRDVAQRGYSKKDVDLAIDKRKKDEILYIEPQKENADVILSFEECNDKSVGLKSEFKSIKNHDIIDRLISFYNLHKHFLLTCRKSCFEYELIQGAGGNLSYKFEDKLIITSSGYTWPQIGILNGFTVCYEDGTIINKDQKRPSMETGFHAKIKDRVVYHTHPIYLNTILCCKESHSIIKDILSEYDYSYIKYYSPGEDLCNNFVKASHHKVVLLENHGLICSGDSFSNAFKESLNINQICKEWLVCNSKTFKTLSISPPKNQTNRVLFPDAAIKPDDNLKINDYMIYNHREAGLTSNFLSDNEVHKLKNMEAEKYRMNLNT